MSCGEVSTAVAELECMSSKRWETFLASLSFDRPLEPWHRGHEDTYPDGLVASYITI